jgi:chemotaxis protein CheX
MLHELLAEEIRKATATVLSTMLDIEAISQPAALHTAETGPSHGVAAMVGLAGRYSGSGSICCTEETACRLAGAMLMSEFLRMDAEVLDAMGEITNMVIGNIKTSLEERFGTMALTTPTVIYGTDFSTRASGNRTWTVVPFAFGSNLFQVRMMLVESQQRVSSGPGVPVMVAAANSPVSPDEGFFLSAGVGESAK